MLSLHLHGRSKAAGLLLNSGSPVLLSSFYLHQSITHFPTTLSQIPFLLLRGRNTVPQSCHRLHPPRVRHRPHPAALAVVAHLGGCVTLF